MFVEFSRSYYLIWTSFNYLDSTRSLGSGCGHVQLLAGEEGYLDNMVSIWKCCIKFESHGHIALSFPQVRGFSVESRTVHE